MRPLTYLNIGNAGYIDELRSRYEADAESVDPTWRAFFEGLDYGTQEAEHNATTTGAESGSDGAREIAVAELILAYRSHGKFLADINPLTPPPSRHPLLELSQFGLREADLQQSFAAGGLVGLPGGTLSAILTQLKTIYCGRVGVEWTHVSNPEEREWLRSRIESGALQATPPPAAQKHILQKLTEAESFERFLHTRYVAQKRFSVEGGDAILPALEGAIDAGGAGGADEWVIGMAHRGRLNVLVNFFDKKFEHIFTQFEGHYKFDSSKGEGDVKYHMGFSTDRKTLSGKPVHLSLANNPSHLEFVNAVVEGMTRAKQKMAGAEGEARIVPILIHGDAAFAGQGVNYEIINLNGLKGYGTGGTLHYVINNQVGFTTSAVDARTTTYCTDLAKIVEAPVLHVNGDDPELVWNASRLAADYRQKFRKDFFIDIVCYRRHGHNEGDEPSYTQPLMYKKIKAHPTPREIYAQRLAERASLPSEQSQALLEARNNQMLEAQGITKKENPTPYVSVYERGWKGMRSGTLESFFDPVPTTVQATRLRELAQKLNTLPTSFHLHPKLTKFFEARLKAVQEGKGIDWGNGEALAYAALLDEGFHVRISGQDAERGTFTHRHAVLSDVETGEKYTPHGRLRDGQGRFEVYNSHLSETGVMGFEFGYASSDARTLAVWEAQFGDFANGAQVIIDQFLSTSESKWQRANGLTLLLPHGYEGQGPEHSSARFERFLQLCGRGNIAVCNLSTPAQIFHALRRQVKRDFRKPLVVMSPKSLLRNPLAISELGEFTDRGFQEVIDDPRFAAGGPGAADQVTRVLLCSGKVYYDLLNGRTERKREDVALVRVEQLYPWPAASLSKILARYPKAKDLRWVQEEPRNMGAWTFVHGQWSGSLCDREGDALQANLPGRTLNYVGRSIAASPAVGSHHAHEHEQKALVEKAFA